MIEDPTVAVNDIDKASEGDPLESVIHSMLRELGEDPGRDALIRTPARVARSLRFLTSGYREELDKVLNGALFPVAYDEMVIVKDIEVFSLCEHHLLPFFGRCHVAYIPNQKVIGLSKIPRVVDVFAKRLQIQERLTVQIAEALMERIKPQGVGVIIEAKHLCMIMRGVEKQNSVAVTSHMMGVFRDCELTRAEFLRLVRERG
jgi:GTP cyclohydrolase I